MQPDIILALHGLHYLDVQLGGGITFHTIGRQISSTEAVYWSRTSWTRHSAPSTIIEHPTYHNVRYKSWTKAGMPPP